MIAEIVGHDRGALESYDAGVFAIDFIVDTAQRHQGSAVVASG